MPYRSMSGFPAKPSSCSRASWSTWGGMARKCPEGVARKGPGELTPRFSHPARPGSRGRRPGRRVAGRHRPRGTGDCGGGQGHAVNSTVTVALAAGAVVVLVAAVALRLADRLGLPSLLLYLALGVAIGESGLGVPFEDYRLTHPLAYAALVVILAEGGLTTRWADVRRAIGPGVALATVISSTDAAAVFATLRRLPLPRRLAASLEAESGLNDAPVILLVTALAESLTGRSTQPWWLVGLIIVAELVGGSVLGIGIGFA